MIRSNLPLDADQWPVAERVAYLRQAAARCISYAPREWAQYAKQSVALAAEMFEEADALLVAA